MPPPIAELNRQYYSQEEGPGDYILTRLYSLALIGSKYREFMQLVAEGLDLFRFQVMGTEPRNLPDDTTREVEERDTRTRDHFVRVEAHHLKHLAIETLLRLYLAHRREVECPWYEISRHTNFGKFKRLVEVQIVDGDNELLKADAAFVFMSQDIRSVPTEDRAHDVAVNLVRFLVRFARAWLDESKSYNATKHGLTAIPDAAVFRVLSAEGSLVPPSEDHSLKHLCYGGWKDGLREWSIATRWIRLHEAIETIVVSHIMMDALWSVARHRQGLTTKVRPFDLHPTQYSTDILEQSDRTGIHELVVPWFVEVKHNE